MLASEECNSTLDNLDKNTILILSEDIIWLIYFEILSFRKNSSLISIIHFNLCFISIIWDSNNVDIGFSE